MKMYDYKPLISIITICYNNVKDIERTMLSVLNQTYCNIEYIIVDGGSTDGTVDIIKKFKNKLSKWISEKDKGIYDAYNKGLYQSTGDLVAYINAGDWYATNDVIEFVAQKYQETQADVLYGDVINVKNGKEYYDSKSNVNLNNMYFFMALHTPAVFMKNTYLKKYGFDIRYKIAADYDAMLKILVDGGKFFYTGSKPLAYFIVDGISANRGNLTLRNYYCISRNNAKRCRKKYYDKLIKMNQILDEIYRNNLIKLIKYCVNGSLMSSKNIFKDNLNNIRKYQFIILGFNELTKMLILFANKYNISIIAIIDDNIELQSKYCNNIPIYPSRILFERDIFDYKILFSTEVESEKVKESLNNIGLMQGENYFTLDMWGAWLIKNRYF